MGTIRVTQRMLVNRVLNNLNYQSRRILQLQEQLSTGQRVNRPSDDPLAARRAVNAQTEVTKNDQYQTNISTVGPQLSESETSLMTVVDLIQRANELTLQGASDTNGQTQRDEIAIEINQVLEAVLVQSNHVTNGRFVFGGTRTLNQPFTVTRDANGEITSVTYEGNDEHFEIEISEGVRVIVNETGEDVFLQTSPATTDIFQTLIDIRDNLRAGDVNALTTRLEELGRAQDQLLVAGARLGAVQNRIERVDSNLQDITLQMEQVISDNIDADFADVILNLNAQSNAFQASLNAGARVIQPSLLDFLQ